MAKPRRPSEIFTEWLDTQIASLNKGTQLPTGIELAKRFNLSVSTVRNVLRRYQHNGSLTLIAGRGTFIGTAEMVPEQPLSSPASSADTIVDFVLRSISEGNIKKGEALPSIKFMSLQFHVAPSTVIKAYRKLQALRHVVKVGKTFWVGGFDTFVSRRVQKTIVMFNYGSQDFSPVFNESWLAPAYRKLERELLTYGYDIQYENLSDLDALLRQWISRDAFPSGFVFFRLNQKRLPSVENALKHFVRIAKTRDCRVLVDWQSGDYSMLPPGVHILSRGNIFTTRARSVADYIVKQGYKSVKLFFDENEKPFDWFLPFVRIRSELKQINSQAEFGLVFKSKGDPGALFSRLYESRAPETISTILSKYVHTPASALEQESLITSDFSEIYESITPRSALLFLEDKMASDALRWMRHAGRKVPEDIGILGFENNPRFYHQKISCCAPDWERIGYLMAHTLIGDFQVSKTSKGFIRVKADVLDRGTV